MYPIVNRSELYYWRVMVDDGSVFENETYNFTTEGYPVNSGGNSRDVVEPVYVDHSGPGGLVIAHAVASNDDCASRN